MAMDSLRCAESNRNNEEEGFLAHKVSSPLHFNSAIFIIHQFEVYLIG